MPQSMELTEHMVCVSTHANIADRERVQLLTSTSLYSGASSWKIGVLSIHDSGNYLSVLSL